MLLLFLHITAFKCRIISQLSAWVLVLLFEETLTIHHTLSGSDYRGMPRLFFFGVITLVIVPVCFWLYVCGCVLTRHYTSLSLHCAAAIRRVSQRSLLNRANAVIESKTRRFARPPATDAVTAHLHKHHLLFTSH